MKKYALSKSDVLEISDIDHQGFEGCDAVIYAAADTVQNHRSTMIII